jgi:hypothetical protein
MEMIVVKLIKLGKPIESYEISDNPTVGNLFDKAGETFVPNTVTINGNEVTESTLLKDNDRVFVGAATKGNVPFEVQLIRIGPDSSVINLPAEDGMTINQVMQQIPADKKSQFFSPNGSDIYEYRLANGSPVQGDKVLTRPESGSMRLMLSTRTKGN